MDEFLEVKIDFQLKLKGKSFFSFSSFSLDIQDLISSIPPREYGERFSRYFHQITNTDNVHLILQRKDGTRGMCEGGWVMKVGREKEEFG